MSAPGRCWLRTAAPPPGNSPVPAGYWVAADCLQAAACGMYQAEKLSNS
ncbi:hypothetical protein [Streptacidiphilus melanogenes]|nr:hypothetical protein [Streptacidiphilus melanogenes]